MARPSKPTLSILSAVVEYRCTYFVGFAPLIAGLFAASRLPDALTATARSASAMPAARSSGVAPLSGTATSYSGTSARATAGVTQAAMQASAVARACPAGRTVRMRLRMDGESIRRRKRLCKIPQPRLWTRGRLPTGETHV